ncbi:MAG: hypothetical protein IIB11_07860, partial [Chloroflexi bacterium]|nr:hypothetical protein [Chloroflexota bacterium]
MRTIEFDKIITTATAVGDRFAGVVSGEFVGLEDGIYSGGLKNVPDGVNVHAVNGLGNVFFEGGDTSFGSILDLTGNGVSLKGLIFRNKDQQTGNVANIFGTNNIAQECGFEGEQRSATIHKHQYTCAIGGSGHL